MSIATTGDLLLGTTAMNVLSKLAGQQIRLAAARGRLAAEFHELRPALERFRYDVYIVELKKALPQADHLSCRLPDVDDDSAYHFVATTKQDEVLGCVRLHISPEVPESARRNLRLDFFLAGYDEPYGYVSKLMVQRTLRGKSVALQMMEAMVEFSRTGFMNAEVCFFHCSPRLVGLYESYGFRRFGLPFADPHVGLQVAMYFIPGDVEYFERIGSPLLRVARGRPIPKHCKEQLEAMLLARGGIA
jgi:predicted GNAT family N-acyltransferase